MQFRGANVETSGNLEDEKVKSEYERGYKVLLEFYHKHL